MLTRIGTVVVVAWLAVGCAPGDDAFDLPDTLATVADDPVTRDQVEPLVEDSAVPLVHVAGERAPSPWRDALDLAVRDVLLAREAARRGIEAPTRSEQIAALVAGERRDHHLGPEAVDDEQAAPGISSTARCSPPWRAPRCRGRGSPTRRWPGRSWTGLQTGTRRSSRG